MIDIKTVAQIIGIFAMAFNVLSYLQKQQIWIIALQLCGSFLFTVHFFILGAYTGGLLNAVGIIRAVVFLNKDKLNATHAAWLSGFIFVYLLFYVLTFTVFGMAFTPWNAVVELLPVIGMTATTFAFRTKKAKSVRLWGLISSPSWLIYNIIALSIGAICCEVLSLISIILGLSCIDKEKGGKCDA